MLKNSSLPIVLYGMGNGADMILDKLSEIGVKPAAIFASDEFVRGHSFRGYKVLRYSEVEERFSDFIIVMCFAVHDEAMLERVKRMAESHTLVAPNVPIVDDGIFDREYIERHDAEFDAAYEALADEFSRKSFIDVLNYKVSGKVEYLFNCEKNKDEIYSEYLCIGNDEIFMDLGAYDGDTLREFLKASGNQYRKLYAVEADEKNYKKLCAYADDLDNAELNNFAAWDSDEILHFEKKKGRNSRLSATGDVAVQARSVDSLLNGEEITVLKMDIEGSEEKALDGARQTILRYKPKLYVCAYHRNSDMFRLPLKIKGFDKNYKIHFCHHPYVPAWESNFYCILDCN